MSTVGPLWRKGERVNSVARNGDAFAFALQARENP